MVIHLKNVPARRSSIIITDYSEVEEQKEKGVKLNELFYDYLGTFAVYRIDMFKINLIIKPILFFSLLFGMSMFGMFCTIEVLSKNLNLINVIKKTVYSVIACVIFGCVAGNLFKWFLGKSRDTHTGSYIYVCLVSLIYYPVTLFLSWCFPRAINIIYLINAIFATFIIEYNLLYDHQFLDLRSSFIFRIFALIIIWIFLLVILPYASH